MKRRSRVAAVAAALLIAAVAAACTPPAAAPPRRDSNGHAELRLDLRDDNRTVGVAVGATFTVELPETQGHGVEWRLAQQPDPAVLTAAVPRSMGGVSSAGATGTEVWTFHANGPGSTTVELYDPPQHFRIVVSVT